MPEVLSEVERTKLRQRDDAAFYAQPRFVHHVEAPFRDRLTRLYREELADGDRVLDLMSSWVSHLPDDFSGEVVGHGLNAEELAANDALADWVVQDLNADQRLPFEDGAFDAVLCAVSVQYLQYPGAVFAEVARVLQPEGACVVSFSNRMFVQKAVRAWRERDMDGRADLVRAYLDSTGSFDDPRVVREQAGNEPFYAVVARRN
jgi:SAM-dependent methyltransferase